ncbi:MAG: hypothetical protein Kow0099_14980 [Candidatus Abyssubacteria bacterium]
MANKGNPEVSVVMGVYNGERYVRQAVESVLRQTFRDFEFIIIDDGSTDGTAEIIRGFDDPRIRIITNVRNEGLTRCLIKGCEEARGRYIARMDADDVSYPHRFQRQVEFLEANPDCAVVGTQCFFIDDKGNERARSSYACSHEEIKEDVWKRSPFAHGSVMMVKSRYEECGGYREPFRFAQDYDLWLRLLEKHNGANVPEVLYRLRYHRDSVTLKRICLQSRYAELARQFARMRAETGSDPLMRGELEGVRATVASWTSGGLFQRLKMESNGALEVLEFMSPWGRISDMSMLLLAALCKNPLNLRAWRFPVSGPMRKRLDNACKYRLRSRESE